LLDLFTFAGLTAQANVNKPSEKVIRPANRRAGEQPRGEFSTGEKLVLDSAEST